MPRRKSRRSPSGSPSHRRRSSSSRSHRRLSGKPSRRRSSSSSRSHRKRSPSGSPKSRFAMGCNKARKYTVYTMEGCGYCKMAKDKLLSFKKNHPEIIVEIIPGVDNPDVEKKMQAIGKGNYPYWPKIFIDDKFIGGYSDLEKKLG